MGVVFHNLRSKSDSDNNKGEAVCHVLMCSYPECCVHVPRVRAHYMHIFFIPKYIFITAFRAFQVFITRYFFLKLFSPIYIYTVYLYINVRIEFT